MLAQDTRIWDRLQHYLEPVTGSAFVKRPKQKQRGTPGLLAALGDEPDTTRDDSRRALRAAVKSSRVEKPEACARCGLKPERHQLHAHHANYDAPLAVEWLCVECHHKAHAT